jgi:hypothetical protein
MKIKHVIILAAAVLGSAAFASGARADDSWKYLSPRAKANQPSRSDNKSENTEVTSAPEAKIGSPKVQSLRLTYAPAGSSRNDPDLVRAHRAIVYTGRSPFQPSQWQQFNIAPLK